MRNCNSCFKREGNHRWGKWWLCDECHEKHYEEWKSKEDTPELKISQESKYGAGGYYRQGTSTIYLVGASRITIEVTLAHEVLHHILNVLIDAPTSFDYDNISGHGKIHKDLFAVRPKRRR